MVLRWQVRPFVIVFVERSGSTFLITALKSNPEILSLTEKLGAMRLEGKSAEDQLAWSRGFLTPPLVGSYRAIGFKTKLIDVLDPDGFRALLQERRCHIIQLQRRNVVKAVVSTLNARRQWEASGNWNRLNGAKSLPAFEVDPAAFATLLAEREELDRQVASYVEGLNLPTLRLWYEDLLRDEEGFLSTVQTFLTGRARPVTAATLKNTGDDLSTAVVNFRELRSRYAGTPYEPMFDEAVGTGTGTLEASRR